MEFGNLDIIKGIQRFQALQMIWVALSNERPTCYLNLVGIWHDPVSFFLNLLNWLLIETKDKDWSQRDLCKILCSVYIFLGTGLFDDILFLFLIRACQCLYEGCMISTDLETRTHVRVKLILFFNITITFQFSTFSPMFF